MLDAIAESGQCDYLACRVGFNGFPGEWFPLIKVPQVVIKIRVIDVD
ncbi:MAG: hypothetical protein ACRDTG_18685 [Pseudonocardiaceae bacterium]